MKARTSLAKRGRAAVALLVILGSADATLGQQEVWLEKQDQPLDLSLGAVQAVANDNSLSSVEQGRTQITDSFGDWREWQLKERREAFKDTKFEFNFRTFFLDRHQFSGAESQAWAIGGWVGLKTGYFLDHFAFGATGYTSQPLYAPKDRDGTTLLKPGQEGYTVLGEAYAEIRIIDDLNLTVGRKGYDTPFINRNDSRMTPNTFQAIVLQGKVNLGPESTVVSKGGKDGKDEVVPVKDRPSIKFGIGYFDQIKERNSDEFVSMSVDAGAKVDRGVFAAGALYEKGAFSIGGIDYFSEDIINIAYAETKLAIPISSDFKPKVAAQFVDQSSVGNNLLDGESFSAHQFGLKIDMPVQKALFTAGFTHAWGNANLRSPWSGYPGYTSVQVQDFNRSGETAFLLRAGYEFPWVAGMSAYALAVFGTTPDQVGQYRQDEYDMNLQWAPPKGVLKGLSLRVRYGIVDQHGGNVDALTDFRAICNYVIRF
ncbi:MAG: OprD family outer membrane porin [Chthoniobacterales bacterium]